MENHKKLEDVERLQCLEKNGRRNKNLAVMKGIQKKK